jgi:hypothetical protein
MVYQLLPPQSEEYVMNTRNSEIRRTADQAESIDARRGQGPFVMELGTVTKETKHDLVPVGFDSFPHIGTMGS